jgi:hypothetical protein
MEHKNILIPHISKILSVCGVIFLSSCTPITTYHGFNATESLRQSANEHTLSLRETTARFGPASIRDKDENGNDILYYVSYQKEQYAFFQPDVVGRSVTRLEFHNEMLADITEYGMKDGHIIDINNDETPAYGKELNAVQQILSNVGRFNSVPQNGNDGSVLGRIPGGL